MRYAPTSSNSGMLTATVVTCVRCLLEGPHVKPIIGHSTGRSCNMVEVRPLSLVSKSWVEKLQRLFDWEDGVTRRWDSADFRLITRESYAILRDCASENEAVAWRRAIGSQASEYITIIPRYERDKLRISEKASPNNSKQVQQARRLGTRQYIWIGAFLPNPQRISITSDVNGGNGSFVARSKRDVLCAEKGNNRLCFNFMGLDEDTETNH